MKRIIVAILLLAVNQNVFSQGIDNTNKNIYGYNRIITGTSDWLDIQLSGAGSTFKIHDNTNGVNWVRWTAGSTHTEFLTNVVLPSSQIGIGTTSPYLHSRLHIKAPSTNNWGIVAESNANDRIIGFGHDGTAGVIATSYLGSGGYSPLQFRTSNITRMTVAVDGNVGIGTTTPTGQLHLSYSNNGINYNQILDGNKIQFDRSNNEASYIDKKDNGSLHFRMGSAFSTKMTINNSGNVGIGTTSPSKLLHVSSAAPSFLLERTGSVSWETRIDNNGRFIIQDATNATEPLKIEALTPTATIYTKSNGNVGIGTADPKSKLAVDGTIKATKVEVMADVNSVPDYVFEEDYELRTLQETKAYIEANKHLPEIPSAAEIGKDGMDLGDMNLRLLKKIEELTLYQIQMMEEMSKMKKELEEMKNVSSK
ncbi:MAG: hypothetical protein ABJF04_22925 [Reichenbachiella sp.]|uniref:hypothetical protein n=1 Tax=Reichenbachiella sp. TaxID=2184521 RepID=UPI0032639FA8